MKLTHRDYANRVTGPYTSEEAVASEVESSGEGGQIERLKCKIDTLSGILGRLIDAMPVRSKHDREELARAIGYCWEADE